MAFQDFPPFRRATPSALRIALLLACAAAIVLYFVFREAIREADDIYESSGFIPRSTNSIPAPKR